MTDGQKSWRRQSVIMRVNTWPTLVWVNMNYTRSYLSVSNITQTRLDQTFTNNPTIYIYFILKHLQILQQYIISGQCRGLTNTTHHPGPDTTGSIGWLWGHTAVCFTSLQYEIFHPALIDPAVLGDTSQHVSQIIYFLETKLLVLYQIRNNFFIFWMERRGEETSIRLCDNLSTNTSQQRIL